VTLGGTSLKKEKRHPTLGDNVVVGAGAGIFGAFTIRSDSRLGAGSVVVREVPPRSVVVGVPGRVTSRNGQRVSAGIDLNQVDLPDPLARTLDQLLDRIRILEAEIAQINRAPELSGPALEGGEPRRIRDPAVAPLDARREGRQRGPRGTRTP
jgi:serine O-acetyltransferase